MSLATISQGPNDPAPEALCERPPDQIFHLGKRLAPHPVCGHSQRMPITVEPFTDSHHDDVYRISRAAWETDVPDIPVASPGHFASMIHRPWPDYAYERRVALLDGVPVGYLQMRMPTADNRHTAAVTLLTEPGRRRCGVGRALCEHAVATARGLGRTHLTAETTDQRPDGAAFATAVGAKPGLPETRSRLDLPPADQPRLDALLTGAWAHADGYRLVQWRGVPADEIIDDVAALDSRLNDEAPQGDLVLEAQNIDADRVRANEAHVLTVGRTNTHTGVVHAATGRLIAWSHISCDDDTPGHAWQQITIVDPAHRGHRLGLIVKLENLRYLRGLQSALTAIDTFNATANEHMLAINDAMGFRRVDQWMQWQLAI